MKKIIAGVLGLAMAVSIATPVAAQTVDINALLAQIAQLQAQLAAMQGGTVVGTVSINLTSDLTVGSTGASVTGLQNFLIAKGYLAAGLNTGYFGALTQAAVAKYQMAKGITPAVGYVGPITRAAINADAAVVVTPGTPTTPGTASGSEGQIDSIDNISADVEDEVLEGEEDVSVLGIEFDAEDSEITIERVDVEITVGSGGSSQLDNYITDISLMLDGKTLDTLDVDEGDEDDDVYSFRFSGLNGMVEEGETAELYIAVSAVNNVDSEDTDVDLSINIPADGIRATDGAGISETYGTSGEIDAEVFNVVEADAGNLDLSIDEDDNEDRVVEVSDDTDTDGVEILNFTIESDASDNNIQDLTINLATTSATTTGFATVMNRLTLFADGEEVGSESVSSIAAGGAIVVFNDIDVDIEEDKEVVFTVEADFNDEADEFQGFDFAATVDASEIDAEDAEGDDVTVTGDVTGGTITLRTAGINVEFVSASTSKDTKDSATDSGTFVIKFDVTAFGEDVFISATTTTEDTSLTAVAANTGVNFDITATSSLSSVLTSTATKVSDSFRVDKGQTKTFTLTVVAEDAVGAFHQLQLGAVQWGTTQVGNMANTRYVEANDYETDPLYLSY